jgi:hypothetical protein
MYSDDHKGLTILAWAVVCGYAGGLITLGSVAWMSNYPSQAFRPLVWVTGLIVGGVIGGLVAASKYQPPAGAEADGRSSGPAHNPNPTGSGTDRH